jgi:hypothetical protein
MIDLFSLKFGIENVCQFGVLHLNVKNLVETFNSKNTEKSYEVEKDEVIEIEVVKISNV